MTTTPRSIDLVVALAKVANAARLVQGHHDDYCYEQAYNDECRTALDRLSDAISDLDDILPGLDITTLHLEVRRHLHPHSPDCTATMMHGERYIPCSFPTEHFTKHCDVTGMFIW